MHPPCVDAPRPSEPGPRMHRLSADLRQRAPARCRRGRRAQPERVGPHPDDDDGHRQCRRQRPGNAFSVAVANVNDAPTGAGERGGNGPRSTRPSPANTSSIADADGLGRIRLPVGAAPATVGHDLDEHHRRDRRQLRAGRQRRGQPGPRERELHRRPWHRREPDQRGERSGRQRQRRAHRRARPRGHGHRRSDPDSQHAASPMPTGWAPSATSGHVPPTAATTWSNIIGATGRATARATTTWAAGCA